MTRVSERVKSAYKFYYFNHGYFASGNDFYLFCNCVIFICGALKNVIIAEQSVESEKSALRFLVFFNGGEFIS